MTGRKQSAGVMPFTEKKTNHNHMKPTHKMIHALRKAADIIARDDSNYSWRTASACNCGTLLKVLDSPVLKAGYNGITSGGSLFINEWIHAVRNASSLFAMLTFRHKLRAGGFWSYISNLSGIRAVTGACGLETATCSVTGLTMEQIAEELKREGFEDGDLEDIEFCGMTGGESSYLWAKPQYVAEYMRNRANELEARRTELAKARLAKYLERRNGITTTAEVDEEVEEKATVKVSVVK